jgi:Ca2+-binding RTX toxin-like protein
MVEIVYGNTVGRNLLDLGIGISWTAVLQTPGGPVVLALSGRGGGLVSLGFDATGQAVVADTQYLTAVLWGAAFGGGAVVQTTTGIVAAVAQQGSQSLVGYTLLGNQIGALTSVSGTGIGAGAGTFYQEVSGFLYAADATGALRCFQSNGAQSFQAGSITPDSSISYHAVPGALGQVQVQGRSYLLTTCLRDVGVSAYEVDSATGNLRHASFLGSSTGLGMYSAPIAIEAATLAGRAYVVVASSADRGAGAALSVLEIEADGRMKVADHILDFQATRFGSVNQLAVVEYGGWVYVIAQGGEQGLSLFTLMPGGKLLHLNSFVGTAAINLASQSTLTATMVGDQLQLLVSTHVLAGFTQFRVDLSDQGTMQQAGPNGGTLTGTAARDMLVGGTGADTLNGGAGNDILSDGAGADRLIGGAGADIFVMAADGTNDVIADFNPAQDKIDLSLIPMLYSIAQVSFASRAWGGILSYRGEELELRSASGFALTSAQVMAALVWGADRPPLVVRHEQRGEAQNDTLTGDEGMDLIRGGGGNDVLSGLAGEDELQGEDGNDMLYAGDGNDTALGGNGNDLIVLGMGDDQGFGGAGRDTIFGGDGNDTVFGDDGDDLIYGGANFDFIDAGDGDDTVFGDDGRDLIYLGAGRDLFNDNSQGGELGQDTVYAGDGDDTIQGGNGNDVFYGEDGNDAIYGRLGNDLIYGGANFDFIDAGDGDDTVFGDDGRDLIYLGNGNDLFNDNSQGGEFGQDTVFAGEGDDTIQGGGGDDIFYGEAGNDVIFGRLGNDLIFAGDNFDFIDSGDGNDTVFGGNGRDTIILGPGNDVYVDTAQGGVLGQDTISGGAGADRFEFQAVMSADVITDFQRGIDTLHLTQSLWGGGLSAQQVVNTYALVTGAGVFMDFGGGQSILLQGLTSTAGLANDIWLG